MNASELKEIIQIVIQAPIEQFSLEYETVKLSISKRSLPVSSEESLPSESGYHSKPLMVPHHVERETQVGTIAAEPESAAPIEIASPTVGIFYSSAEPGEDPLIRVGDSVTETTVVGIVEAMKLFNEIQAGINGVITEILIESGQLVQYDQPLFLVKPVGV
ncbi:acetyl-CoA carboxylase biotin carboxyl carrier protein [Paenibacillus sp. WQ 127069]|uniref:Biotin carboxyl carrier protein of acetyl-CoA carboxylase n=1 Tax=Paenibacillus baimaensis TaxID=2982185 RepID=A0ABT2UMT9_9BACL|nr:acetyl-CoA carboxylase biotin carboxyl carrier protein [Paenibacillus sp. WQ 127069]MCU6795892.1 acetyl-CoA carboxylase biotin carboxyl carrier protein [Paenibacillus sp. WQ 127069]